MVGKNSNHGSGVLALHPTSGVTQYIIYSNSASLCVCFPPKLGTIWASLGGCSQCYVNWSRCSAKDLRENRHFYMFFIENYIRNLHRVQIFTISAIILEADALNKSRHYALKFHCSWLHIWGKNDYFKRNRHALLHEVRNKLCVVFSVYWTHFHSKKYILTFDSQYLRPNQ